MPVDDEAAEVMMKNQIAKRKPGGDGSENNNKGHSLFHDY